MDLSLVPLIGTAIDYYRQLFSDESNYLEGTVVTFPINITLQTVDNRKLEAMVQSGVEYLGNLIEEQTSTIVSELRRLGRILEKIQKDEREQYLKNVIHDMQANISSLKSFLELPPDHQSTDQLVVTALHPLQTSIEKARLTIAEFGVPDLWTACSILGKTAQLSGYRYLKFENTELQDTLLREIANAQERILNRTAAVLFREENTFPWSKVPHLLSIAGFDDLMRLHEHALDLQRSVPWPSKYYSAAWKVAAAASHVYEVSILKNVMSNYKWKSQEAIKARLAEIGDAALQK